MRHKRRKCGRGQWPVSSEQLAVERGHGTWIVERGTWNVDMEHGPWNMNSEHGHTYD